MLNSYKPAAGNAPPRVRATNSCCSAKDAGQTRSPSRNSTAGHAATARRLRARRPKRPRPRSANFHEGHSARRPSSRPPLAGSPARVRRRKWFARRLAANFFVSWPWTESTRECDLKALNHGGRRARRGFGRIVASRAILSPPPHPSSFPPSKRLAGGGGVSKIRGSKRLIPTAETAKRADPSDTVRERNVSGATRFESGTCFHWRRFGCSPGLMNR